MPVYVPRTRFRKVKNPVFRNGLWERWGLAGQIIGGVLIFLGIALSVIEIVRILNGPTNRGVQNGLDQNLLFRIHQNATNLSRRVDKMHYWPWTYAANLFGGVTFFAGVAGVMSAYRRSYSSLFAFLSLSLLTTLLSGYLIGYYSVLVNYYKSVGNDRSTRPNSMNVGWAFILTNLCFSILSCLFGFFGFVSAFMGLRGCTPKGLNIENLDNRVPYTQLPPPPQQQPRFILKQQAPPPPPPLLLQPLPPRQNPNPIRIATRPVQLYTPPPQQQQILMQRR